MPKSEGDVPVGSPPTDSRLAALAGRIEISRAAAGEFRVMASGLWTPEYVDAHFAQLRPMLRSARGRTGVRVLVDLRAALVQTAASADRIRYWTGDIYQAVDRVAMLFTSRLLMLQMRRVAMIAMCEYFFCEVSAQSWLMEHGGHGAVEPDNY